MSRLLSLPLSLLLLPASASALYVRPDLEQVPIEQLANNLEELAAKKPQDAKLRLNLARLHAMAYALKSDTAKVRKGSVEKGVWFGYEPKFVPFETKPADDPKTRPAAREHLQQAIADYRKAVALDPQNLTAQLGLGWCLKEANQTKQAIAQLRKTIKLGWSQEKKLQAGRLGNHYITVEAAQYLIPLLDKQSDGEEIAELRRRKQQLDQLPRLVTPIAVPLADNLTPGQMLDPHARVAFDADGSGKRDHWTWIRSNSGWLVYDRGDSGKITSAIEMFGSVTFWLFWDNGYQALEALDNDGDGQLRGGELRHLAIWHDANANGISEPGEVRPLDQHGIVSVSCRGRSSHTKGVAAECDAGVRLTDGTTRPTFDLLLKQSP